MDRPFFSICIPVYVWNDYRKQSLARALKSVEHQTFQDFECIVVNDGSTQEFHVPEWVRLITQPNLERIHAFENGLKNTKGDWICFLDSDDAYDPDYLQVFYDKIQQNPRYRLFNCGSQFIWRDGDPSVRSAFRPGKARKGHAVFGGGNIVNGTFVFSREIYDKLGGFPHDMDNADCTELNYPQYKDQPKPIIRSLSMCTPYDFSAAAQLEFPEIRSMFMVDVDSEPHKVIKELGNPWGNDYYLFYKYTRKYKAFSFDDPLLTVYIKRGIE